MILPTYVYGHPVLKKICTPIESFDGLEVLIANMWETMYNASGVGLAAPQVGEAIKLFIVDSKPMFEEGEEHNGIKKVFINAEILEEYGPIEKFEEGCLSIPHLRGTVERPSFIKIKYLDENQKEHTEVFDGINARVIQHEYDHILGKLFVERLKPIKKRLLAKKLDAMKKGKVEADYKLKFAARRR
ncbi:MAG TPA: peptide deformylase [Saprospiraceae bacterium]|nr:peptide deformylase [Saprospiraceae bacterium]